MFTVKYKDVTQASFMMALQKMAGQPLNDKKVAYRFKKISDKIISAKNKIRDHYQKEIAQKYGEMDTKGNLIPDTNEYGYKLKADVDNAELQKDLEAFGEHEIEIDREKLSLSDFDEIKVAPSEFSALDCIIQDPDTAPPAGLAPVPAHVVSIK